MKCMSCGKTVRKRFVLVKNVFTNNTNCQCNKCNNSGVKLPYYYVSTINKDLKVVKM